MHELINVTALGSQLSLPRDQATELFQALGAALGHPIETLGVDEYDVLTQWEILRDQGVVAGEITLAEARTLFWNALDGVFLDTTRATDAICAYLSNLENKGGKS